MQRSVSFDYNYSVHSTGHCKFFKGLTHFSVEKGSYIVRNEKRNCPLGKTSLSDLIDDGVNREIGVQKLIVEWKRLTDTLVREKDIIPNTATTAD